MIDLDRFRDVDLVIDKANDNFIAKQWTSTGDKEGRTLTVMVTNGGIAGEITGATASLLWTNKANGLTDETAFVLKDKATSTFTIEYPNNMLTPGTVIAQIRVWHNGKTITTKPFEITVSGIAGQMAGVVKQQEFGLLTAVLADANKFRYDIDRKTDKTYVDAMLSSIASGGPRELFYSLSALKAKYPSGAEGTYLVFDASLTDGAHSYMWKDGSWVDLGVYQGLELDDGYVTSSKIADNAVTVAKNGTYSKVYSNNQAFDSLSDTESLNKVYIINQPVRGELGVDLKGVKDSAFIPKIELFQKINTSTFVKVDEYVINQNLNTDTYTTIKLPFKISDTNYKYYLGITGFRFLHKTTTGAGWFEKEKTSTGLDNVLFNASLINNRVIDIVIGQRDTSECNVYDFGNYIDVSAPYFSPADNQSIFVKNKPLPPGKNRIYVGCDYNLTKNNKIFLFRKTSDNRFIYLKEYQLQSDLTTKGWWYCDIDFYSLGTNDVYVGFDGVIAYNSATSIYKGTGHYEVNYTPGKDSYFGTYYTNTNLWLQFATIPKQNNLSDVTKYVATQISLNQNKRVSHLDLTDIILKMSRGDEVNVSCYGDSTYYGHKSGAIPLGTQTSRPAPMVLQDILRGYFNNNTINVRNFGVNGHRSSSRLSNWDDLMANDSADVVFINYGINDASNDVPPNVYKNNMLELIEIAKKHNKLVIVDLPNPVLAFDKANQGMGNPAKSRKVKAYVALMKQFYQYNDVPVVDNNTLSQYYINNQQNPTIALPDGMHPSDDMYCFKASQMASIFCKTNDFKVKKGSIVSVADDTFNLANGEFSLDDSDAVQGISKNIGISFYLTDASASLIIDVVCNHLSTTAKVDGKIINLTDDNAININNLSQGYHVITLSSVDNILIRGLSAV